MRRDASLPGLRRVAVAAALVSVCVCVAGCASMASGANAADPDAIAEVASGVGIAPELVYTTAVDGYDLAPQSVGPGAADGMTASWFNSGTGATLTIRTDAGELTDASCAATPLWDAPDESVTCRYEDGVWHRSGGGFREYIAVRDSALIRVTGMDDASQEDLLAAATAVRVPTEAELEMLFSDLPASSGHPVERGDLPENGDGAPIDPTGPGG
jgi:hypothetical protein